ncbi:MAG: serine/threonine protein kinase [Planctomycetaceae bacterium]|nr:serine/threonine protein kinase [Planctomycetaceae bacterium]
MNEPQPEQIGPYKIERRLGAGGMGTVYLGRHVETGREAAVKVLPASMARETGFVARFTREIDAMRQLKSPQIVEVYENGVDNGTYFYAMEYVPGETVTDRLRREKRIPWREVVDIGVQICKALKSAHNSGIIHRDLKPSNLLLRNDGVVKLTDFGVAQVFAGDRLTVTGGMIGTAEYMSPEQAAGQRATKRSDIYSLGAVLYVMLTGRPPFVGETAMAIAQKHRFNQFDSPRRLVPEVPHWLDEVVCQCLEKKPEDRVPDAYVLSLRLAEVPKKVDYSKGSETFEFADPTSGEGEDTQSSTVDRPAMPAEIGGTLMRDLMRAHVDTAAARGRMHNLLDNTWVLIGLLALVIVGGIVWHRGKQVTPDELFARGVALMDRPRGAAWDSARDEVFAPLVKQDSDAWGPKAQPYLDRIAAYEAERELRGSDYRRASKERTEIEQLLLKGLDERDAGRLAAAEQTFAALATLLDGIPDQERWFRITRQLLADLRMQRAAADEAGESYALLKSSLERAAELQNDGDLAGAQAIWRSAVDLYHDDPGAAPMLAPALLGLQLDAPAAADPGNTSGDKPQ